MDDKKAVETLIKAFPNVMPKIAKEENEIFDLRILYRCDPTKNTKCTKENCGTLCTETTVKEYAKINENGDPIRTQAFIVKRKYSI